MCIKMPIIRKVTTVGASRGITLPKSWLEWIERESGQEITEVTVEIDKVLTIQPVLNKKKVEQ